MEVVIGKGDMAGKGVYANKDFKKGEVVIEYHLKPLSLKGFEALPDSEKMFTHSHKGQIYIYSEPERYVNHSSNGNVRPDLNRQCDVAVRDIKKGEMVTGNPTYDEDPILKKVDAFLVKVPDIESGLNFYHKQLGMQLRWRKENAAAVKLGESELVLSTELDPETDILVDSVEDAIKVFTKAGGVVEFGPEDIPVGKVAEVKDPFGNKLTILDLSKGLYQTDKQGNVTGVDR
jgi:catechol 2,3-dioxygenase-like lactoylglutathione lyase family enzyme